MTAIGRLVRTTAFKLTLVYLVVFAALSLALITYISTTTTGLIDSQIEAAIDVEIRGLSEQYQSGGLQRLIRSIERRSVRPHASLYLITDYAGNRIAGNIASLSSTEPIVPSGELIPVVYERLGGSGDEAGASQRRAIARVFVLPGGFQLLVGRDVEDRLAFAAIIRRAIRAAIGVTVLLALVSWLFVSRRVLKRIDAIAESGRAIVAGDLSGRLPTDGTGDEFDRLASSLNVMLERIEQLHEGLREVSDNIAHDLKTPLTRIRNRIEETLRQNRIEAESERALRDILEESETLIRTFDALLMIARVESATAERELVETDFATLARDIAELYEPVAEEGGAELQVEADRPVTAPADPELVRLLLANLIDNAIKHGRTAEAADGLIRISVRETADGAELAVTDGGPGIPADQLDHVTGRFVRLDTSRSRPGAGLGLSLVKAVVHHHGARMSLENLAPGLRVRIVFPGHAAARHS